MTTVSEILDYCIIIRNKITKLVNTYNKEFPITLPEFLIDHPKCYNKNQEFNKQLICFYENYHYYFKLNEYISKLLGSINYSLDDLYIKLNRSPTYIVSYYSELSKLTTEFKDYKQELNYNITTLVDVFNNTIIEQKDSIKITSDIINLILNTPYNLELSISFIQVFHDLNLLSYDNIYQINDKIVKLRNELLNIQNAKKISYKSKLLQNKLQRFKLIPEEMDSISLSEVINKLFNISSNDLTLKNISNTILNINKQTNKNCGIIIIYNNNHDIYFNLVNLFDKPLIDQFTKITGVNSEYIDAYKTLKINYNESSNKEDQLIAVNINDKTKHAYVLWTSNFTTFKYSEALIDKPIIDKIMRNEPSEYIERYNQELENMISEEINENLKYEFKKVKYYDFNDVISEDEYLIKIKELIINFLISIGQLPNIKSLNDFIIYINKQKTVFDNEMVQLLISHPPVKIKDEHTTIMFIYEITKISKKIKKECVDLSIKDLSLPVKEFEKNFKEIVEYAVGANDNIYTKIINSYYLCELQYAET